MYYYERLKALREERGYTQSNVAKILNVQLPVYAFMEMGRKELTATQLTLLCKFYKVSADTVLGLNPDPSAPENAPAEEKEAPPKKAPKPRKNSAVQAAMSAFRQGFRESAEEEAERKSRQKEMLSDAKRKNNY